MNAIFSEAIGALRENDLSHFEKLIKQYPQLLEIHENNRSLLLYAILNDRLRAVQFLNKKCANLFEQNPTEIKVLHWAAVADARRCAKYIINLTSPVQHSSWVLLSDNRQITPLHLAAKFGHAKLLKILLSSITEYENFYQLVLDSVGQSPLHYAASFGHVECCEILMDERLGLPIDQKDYYGNTPIMCASASPCIGAVDVVRSLGSRKMFSASARDSAGRSALHHAIIANNIDVISVMLDELECPSETFDNDARTPLHYAAQLGKVEVVKKLLKNKARNATRDCFGVSPAHYAAHKGYISVIDSIFKYIDGKEQYDSDGRSCFMWAVIADQEKTVLHFLEEYNPDRSHHDRYGFTALHHAAHVGSLRLVKLLVKEGWNIHETENGGLTAMHLAAGCGHTDIVRLLMMIGANSDQSDRQGRTPIFYACLGGQAHTLKVLLNDLNSKASHTDKLGRTALHCAAFGGFTACIEVLLNEGSCPIYQEDIDQLTSLHIACARGKLDCVKCLLNFGAAVNALSFVEDWTPLSCAQINGHQQVVDYLQRCGGLFPNQLRTLAAVIIQKWWRYLKQRNCLNRRKQ